jgi:hypothetical protein
MVMTAHHIGSYRATSNATGRDTKERHERDTFPDRESARGEGL